MLLRKYGKHCLVSTNVASFFVKKERWIFHLAINPIRSAKEIFVYRFIDNKSVKEIAGIIGCSNGRVSQLITNYLNE